MFYVRFWELPPENESEILFSCYHMKQREKNFTLFLLSINFHDVRCSLSLEICLFVRYHNRAAVFRKKIIHMSGESQKNCFRKNFPLENFFICLKDFCIWLLGGGKFLIWKCQKRLLLHIENVFCAIWISWHFK